MIKAFESLLNEVPCKLQTDKGKEFFNKHFQNMTKKHDITHFAPGTELKTCVIEQFNGMLKCRMWRYLTDKNNNRYIDILQDIMDGYNASYHRSIKIRPIDENESVVFYNLYGSSGVPGVIPRSKYKVGDTVRLYDK